MSDGSPDQDDFEEDIDPEIELEDEVAGEEEVTDWKVFVFLCLFCIVNLRKDFI